MKKIFDAFSFLYTISYIITAVITAPELIPILKKNASNTIKKGNEITYSKLVICDDEQQQCQAIDKFRVSENNTFNCFQNEIEILFNLEKLEVSGFFSDGLSHILKHKSELTTVCKKLKRFEIFQ
jgi:hypothetical protein